MIELANDRWFPVVNLTLATVAAVLWYLSSGRIGWPLLVLILVPWGLRLAAGHFPYRRSRFDPWLLLFGATAVIGTFTAYNAEQAAGKFWVLIGAMAVYFAVVSLSRRDIWLLAGATGPVGAMLAVYFVVSNNWRQWPAELSLFNRIGMVWMSIRPSLPLPVLHPNTLGGMMALLLPFTIAFGIYSWQKRQIRWVQAAVGFGAITAGGLLFTSSVGAWLALAAGLGFWVLWQASGRLQRKLPFSQKIIFGTFLFGLLCLSLLVLFAMLRVGAGQQDAATRLGLAQQTIFLIEDFALTGSGLATFPALYAQYMQVTPSFFAAYSNFYLDIWLEQGVFALVAAVALMGGSFWLLFRQSALVSQAALPEPDVRTILEKVPPVRRRRRKKMSEQEMTLFRWAAFVSLVVMALHGLIDDALYGAQASPLLFFAPAMVVLVTRRKKSAESWSESGLRRRWTVGIGATAVLLFALLVGFRQTVQARWYANMGSLALAQAELEGWPTDRWDAGNNLERFDKATALFERALAIDPQNRTANQRLGFISMVKRDYETAVSHLEAAARAAQVHRGITKSLGFSYVWTGQLEQAAHTLVAIPESRAEMFVYTTWWQRQQRPDLASKAAEMVAILENATLSNP